MITASVRFFGIVQGVFCRKYVCETALRMGIRGTICNESDGTVKIECECEGETELEEFLRELKEGRKEGLFSGIKIEKALVEEKKEIKKGNFASFEIFVM